MIGELAATNHLPSTLAMNLSLASMAASIHNSELEVAYDEEHERKLLMLEKVQIELSWFERTSQALLLGVAVSVGCLSMTAMAFAQDESQDESQDKPVASASDEPEQRAEPLPAIGYVDSPYIPGTAWRVHDIDRPRPRIVEVAPVGQPAKPPADAIVLFDGTDLSHWRKNGSKPGELLAAEWEIDGEALVVNPNSGSIRSVDTFGDCQLHIEWSAPTPVESSSQGRGNSGVIIMGRYEIQVLDSYNNITYADGQAASIYGQYPPMVNVTQPPGEWNVYDIVFKAPKFDGDKLVAPAYATIFHNGVLVQYDRQIIGAVAHKGVGKYEPHPPAGPLHLQDHGNKTRFRNIWVRPLELD